MNAFIPHALTEMPTPGLFPGRLFRAPMPYGHYDSELRVFDQLGEEEIRLVVALIEPGEDVRKTGRDLFALYQQAGYEVIHSPILDFQTPPDGQLEPVIDRVRAALQAGQHVMVHCNAGYGRTGIFMGCFARRVLGMGGEAAVTWVRSAVPTALENEAQVAFVQQFS